jgi:hypothetical protein
VLRQQWNASIRFSMVLEGTGMNLVDVSDADQLDPSTIKQIPWFIRLSCVRGWKVQFDGRKLFIPTLLVEVERRQLKYWVTLYALVSVRRGDKKKHMHSLIGLGRVRWRVHMNGPSKSSSNPCRHATSFSRLLLLCVQCIFNMETGRIKTPHKS